jgi:hypothetical protein
MSEAQPATRKEFTTREEFKRVLGLPTLQKATLGVALIWVLSLHYFATREDFAPRPTA